MSFIDSKELVGPYSLTSRNGHAVILNVHGKSVIATDMSNGPVLLSMLNGDHCIPSAWTGHRIELGHRPAGPLAASFFHRFEHEGVEVLWNEQRITARQALLGVNVDAWRGSAEVDQLGSFVSLYEKSEVCRPELKEKIVEALNQAIALRLTPDEVVQLSQKAQKRAYSAGWSAKALDVRTCLDRMVT